MGPWLLSVEVPFSGQLCTHPTNDIQHSRVQPSHAISEASDENPAAAQAIAAKTP